MTKRKSNLSLKRLRNRKVKQKLVTSYKNIIKDVQLVTSVKSPFRGCSNTNKEPEFTAVPLSSKRKYSPFKSPLTKVKIPRSPFVRQSPLKKKSKTSARALFTVKDELIRPTESIEEESFKLINAAFSESDHNPDVPLSTHDNLSDLPKEGNQNLQELIDLLPTEIENLSKEDIPKEGNQNLQELIDLLPTVIENLSKEGFDDAIVSFVKQVASGKFPLNNIAFMLWVDVVRWFDCSSTTLMRYSEDTKKFWKLGYRIFGGRFVNFMSGYKNNSQIVLGDAIKGNFIPESSDINFAVPSFDVLRTFEPYGHAGNRSPGLLADMIETLSFNLDHRSACLTYDGKKLKQGLTNTSGDVDILGFEPGKTLHQRQLEYQERIRQIDEVGKKLNEYTSLNSDVKNLSNEKQKDIVNVLKPTLSIISQDIIDVRDLKRKKEYAKGKLIERGGETNWRESKFVYAISGIIAFLHDVEEYSKNALGVLEEICRCISYLNHARYVTGSTVNLSTNKYYVEISDDEKSMSTRNIKQRSDEWFMIRQQAKVTGSTLFRAIGLESLQKMKDHFDTVICGVPERTPPVEVENAMKHGTLNEPNAVGTIVGKVIPVMHPELIFFEEGCVEIQNQNDKTFMVVSPDGSLRQNSRFDSTQVGIELKCPYFKPQTCFPQRYLLQCLAEIEVLNVESLIYLSWTSTESLVFQVERDTEFFQRALKYALMLYDGEHLKKPTKLPTDLQDFRKDLIQKCQSVKLVGIFPSLRVDNTCPDTDTKEMISVEEIQALCNRINDVHESCYNIKRVKASEAMVFLCCDLDRGWEKNSIKSAPVCWFPKGYSLQTDTLRKVAEEVHSTCQNARIHVPAQSFDGQWHTIAVRSIDGRPLTILQLQKDVWKEAERMQKSMIIKEMRKLNRTVYSKFQNGKIICSNGDQLLPVLPPKEKECLEKNKEIEENNNSQTVTLSDAVPEQILESQEVSNNVLALCRLDLDGEAEAFSCNINENEWASVIADESYETISEELDKELQTQNMEEGDQQSVEIEPEAQTANEDSIQSHETEVTKHKLTSKDAQNILSMLQTDSVTNRKGIWDSKTANDLLEAFRNLLSLRDVDLRIIVRYVKRTLGIKVRESNPKQIKVNELLKYLDLEQADSAGKKKSSKSKKRCLKIKSLEELAADVLSKHVSKHQLNVAIAGYIWPSRYQKWVEEGPLRLNPKVDDTDYPTFWFYQPDFSDARQQLEVRCIDSTHILTRTRRKCCKGGLDGVSNEPWLNVAKSKKTFLSLIMVQEIVEPMSVMMALTHFSEQVEMEMRNNGDVASADLCRDIRHWWLSEDEPGISAKERIQMRMNLRERLLSHVKFGQFPPKTVSISGWPLQLWEALIANIDAKSLLYALCHNGTYNVRAFSSMMGETFFSELTLADKRGHGTVTSEEFGQFIGTSIEQLQVRLDPER